MAAYAVAAGLVASSEASPGRVWYQEHYPWRGVLSLGALPTLVVLVLKRIKRREAGASGAVASYHHPADAQR